MSRRNGPAEHPELVAIRAQLFDLEIQEAQIAATRRRLQARRAELLEETEGFYACHTH